MAVGMVRICNCSNSSGALQIPYIWDAVNGPRTISVPDAKGLSRINANNMAIGRGSIFIVNGSERPRTSVGVPDKNHRSLLRRNHAPGRRHILGQ